MTPRGYVPGTLRMGDQDRPDRATVSVRVGARNPVTDLGDTGADTDSATTDGGPNRIENPQPVKEDYRRLMGLPGEEPQSEPVDFALSLPEGCFIDGLRLRHSPDCCSGNDEYQTLDLEFVDGGGGGYCVIKSERWGADAVDLARLLRLVKTVVEHNEKLSKEEMEK